MIMAIWTTWFWHHTLRACTSSVDPVGACLVTSWVLETLRRFWQEESYSTAALIRWEEKAEGCWMKPHSIWILSGSSGSSAWPVLYNSFFWVLKTRIESNEMHNWWCSKRSHSKLLWKLQKIGWLFNWAFKCLWQGQGDEFSPAAPNWNHALIESELHLVNSTQILGELK